MTKIHIIGGPGSGTTYLGEKLSQEYGFPYLELDNIYWDNESSGYNTYMPEEKRDFLLDDFIKKENFIVEGVYDKWVGKCFDIADVIIILNPNKFLRGYRIIKRFFLRKLGLAKGRKTGFKELFNFLLWSNKYERVNLPRVMLLKDKYPNKTYIFSKADVAFENIKNVLK